MQALVREAIDQLLKKVAVREEGIPMGEMVRWLRIVALLLAVLVVQVGWVGVQLLIRPAQAQGIVDVRIRSIDEHPSLRWEAIPVRVQNTIPVTVENTVNVRVR